MQEQDSELRKACMFTRIITTVGVVYTLLAGALVLWAGQVALPTKGGISPSEVTGLWTKPRWRPETRFLTPICHPC